VEIDMEDYAPTTQFQVTIEYRTPSRLAVWSGMVPASSFEEATIVAEKSLRRRSRALVRVDRIVVR
jgi:hypothetical protein